MVIPSVKPIAMGIAFFFIVLIASATANDANAKQRYHKGDRCDHSQFCNRGYGGGNYFRRGWSYYAGVKLGFSGGHRYPYYYNNSFNYFGHGYGNPYFHYFNDDFYDYNDAPYYYRPASTAGRCGVRWSKSWRRCCDARYQSFNPGTGKYLTYAGSWKFCR